MNCIKQIREVTNMIKGMLAWLRCTIKKDIKDKKASSQKCCSNKENEKAQTG